MTTNLLHEADNLDIDWIKRWSKDAPEVGIELENIINEFCAKHKIARIYVSVFAMVVLRLHLREMRAYLDATAK